MYDAGYLRAVRALCDAYDVYPIADEIAVGCGRTGTFFACEQAGIWPDLICLSKDISDGLLPLSLVMTRDTIYEAFLDDDVARGYLHWHSYMGNALACRAVLAVLDCFAQDHVLQRNRERAEVLTRLLEPLRDDPSRQNINSADGCARHVVARQGYCALHPIATQCQNVEDAYVKTESIE